MDQKIAWGLLLGIVAPTITGCAAEVHARAVPPPPPRAEIVVETRPPPPPPKVEVVVEAKPPPPPPKAEVVVAVAPPPPPPREEIIITAPPPPPPMVVEVKPPPPSREHLWIEGYHRWDGRAYIWVPGRWEVRPRANVKWVPARWEPRGAGKVWVEGHWG
jgi:hypothetical protein